MPPKESEADPKPTWKQWCRLCAKEDPVGNVDVFGKGPNDLPDTTLATAIGKYFWVNMKPTDKVPHYVCWECHVLVTALINFTDRVNKVQSMFGTLQATNLDNPNELREQYDLFDDNRCHIIKKPTRDGAVEDFETAADLLIDPEAEALQELEESEFQFEDAKCVKLKESRGVDGGCEYTFEYDGGQTEAPAKPPKAQEDSAKQNVEPEEEVEEEEEEEVETSHLYKQVDYAEDELLTEEGDSLVDDLTADPIHEPYDEEEQLLEELDEQHADQARASKRAASSGNEAKPETGEPLVKRRRGRPPKYNDIVVVESPPPVEEDSPIYECKLCAKKYKNLTSYRKHMVAAHETEPDIPEYMCQQCDKSFPTERQLTAHARIHLPPEEKLINPCPYCDKKFSKVTVLRQHINGVHYLEKPFICDECGRPLKTLAALNEHKLVHSTDYPFECDVCGKKFKNKPRLKVHYDTHTETTYACTVCGMQLNTRRTLNMHMLVHSNDCRYKCHLCGNEFKRSKALKNHLILHTGMRPYTCNFCGRSFSNGSNCRTHKKKTHPELLAEEEAKGVKSEPTIVPKLAELRNGQHVVNGPGPRKVKRNTGSKTGAKPSHSITMDGELEAAGESTNDSQYAELGEEYVLGNADNMGLVSEDEGEGETVIYEIIDEI